MIRQQFVTEDGSVFPTIEEAESFEKDLNTPITISFTIGTIPPTDGQYVLRVRTINVTKLTMAVDSYSSRHGCWDTIPTERIVAYSKLID